MAHGAREIEIKLPVADAASAAGLLEGAGFRVSQPRVFERNTIFDTPEKKLRNAGALVRVREVRGAAILTYKGPADPASKYKSREELEVRMADGPAISAILERLGLQRIFRYEKHRTEYQRDGQSGIATLDETPVGVYLELEGEPEWIDHTAALLGFAQGDYITASYGQLYLDWCERRGLTPGDMVFG